MILNKSKIKGQFFRGFGASWFILIFILVACPCRKKPAIKIPVYTEQSGVINKGENLQTALNRLGANPQLTISIINALQSHEFPFRRCQIGDSIKIIKQDGEFFKFVYRRSPTHIYYLHHHKPYLVASMKLPYIETDTCYIAGVISSTLYESLLKIGERPQLVYRFADIFAWEIDFTTETQNGDSFYLFLEKSFCDSTFLGYTHISLLRYKGLVGDYYGIYYKDPEEHYDYYNLKGESLRKALLKSPLKYSYISSYFSKRRFHPILKIWRPHHGLDYSAPTGTPVSSIGDGVVSYKGWRGGYGNLIEIRHKNRFKSRYAHLARFAKGLYVGKQVKMGELIGYVGSTGLSTGPHLHFELHKDGKPINPLKIELPRAPSVKKRYLADFEAHRDSLLALIADILRQKTE